MSDLHEIGELVRTELVVCAAELHEIMGWEFGADEDGEASYPATIEVCAGEWRLETDGHGCRAYRMFQDPEWED
jgi:hypothetical protein